MKNIIVYFGLALAVAACANQQYAGINFGDVTLPNGERWVIAGGKDETNVEFEVVRADGTSATYRAENANASAVLAEMATIQARQLQMLSDLLSRIPTP